jgi:hypothetical protein
MMREPRRFPVNKKYIVRLTDQERDELAGPPYSVDLQEKPVAVPLIQTSGRNFHRDFETTVM